MSDTQKHTKPNVPNLRFPGFEGEWARCTLGEIGEPYIGLTYSPADVVNEGGTIVFRSSNIQNGEIDYSDIVRVNKKIKYSIITRKDDLLICARNGSPRLIGKNALLKEADAGQTFGAFMLVFRSMDNHFVHQLLSTKGYYSQVSENLGARINQITTSNIKDFEFYFPPSTAERNKIAQFLDLIDERISIQNKVIEKYESLIKAITRCLVHCNGHQCFLGDIAEIYQPKTITGLEMSNGGQYPVFGANGIIGHYKDYNHASPQICIACRGNTCGVLNYTLPFSWITGNSMVINVDSSASGVNKRFLFHLLSTVDYSPLISGSGQPQIVRGPLRKLRITLPDKQCQDKNAQIIDCLIEKSNVEKALLRKLQTQKNYFLTTVFI